MRVRIKKENGMERRSFVWTGDLQKEVDKSYKELLKKQSDLTLLDAIFHKADKEKKSCERRIELLQDFLKLVKKEEGIVPKEEYL